MQRSEIEHVIRASGDIADDDKIVIIGSQSILGEYPDAPAGLLASMEADIYPMNKPELAEKVDGAIGEGSSFHAEFGYYAQGVSPKTATLPDGWDKRLIAIQNGDTRGVTGLCLEAHDLAVSKYVAGRPKDFEFIGELVRHKMIEREILLQRLSKTDLPEPGRLKVKRRIEASFKNG